MKTSMIGDPDS